jgi:hypothetical protein
MSYSRETKRAAQDAYHEARAFGHTKEEARGIRDNWKPSTPSNSSWGEDEDDNYYVESYYEDDEYGIDGGDL